MPVPNCTAGMIGLATGEKGSSGTVIDPFIIDNATPLNPFKEIPNSVANCGNSGTNSQYIVYSENNQTDTISNAHLTTDQLARVLHGVLGTGTHGTTGTTAHTWTWASSGSPWEYIFMDRYSTASAKQCYLSRCYISSLRFQSSGINSPLLWTIGFSYAKAEREAANASLSVPTLVKELYFGSSASYQSVFSFTPNGGSLVDLLATCTSIQGGWTRNITGRKAPVATHPNAGVPDPASMVTFDLSFTCEDASILLPTLANQAMADGAISGTLPAAQAIGALGTFEAKFLGGMTTGDATVPASLDIAGSCRFTGSGGANFSGKLVCLTNPTVIAVNDVASIARPT